MSSTAGLATENLVSEALPTATIDRDYRTRFAHEGPLFCVKTPDTRLAAYVINGPHVSTTTVRAVKQLLKVQGKTRTAPCFVVPDPEHLPVIAFEAVSRGVPIITTIAGRGTIIHPRRPPRSAKVVPIPRTRISLGLLKDCQGCTGLSKQLRDRIAVLVGTYPRSHESWSDEKEARALQDFFIVQTRDNGIRRDRDSALKTLRAFEATLQQGKRDHYFHSFQNYFYGLRAIGDAAALFRGWAEAAGQGWRVSPEFVWFLTAMWHDVGRCVGSLAEIRDSAFGVPIEVDTADPEISRYLTNPHVKRAKRGIASFMEHLLCDGPATAWSEPSTGYRATKAERHFAQALTEDALDGHGTLSALRLCSDMLELVRRCSTQAKRQVLEQSMWVAAASIPFHDRRFRAQVRAACGSCTIPALTMPFAVLLAYVDSLQEDRREREAVAAVPPFLLELVVLKKQNIEARVDAGALDETDLLWKILEARDASAALQFKPKSISVTYPELLRAELGQATANARRAS